MARALGWALAAAVTAASAGLATIAAAMYRCETREGGIFWAGD